MKTLKMRHVAWIFALVLLVAACALCVSAAGTCEHAEGYTNGFCIGCGEAQAAVYNSDQGCYEISNAGQLYWFADLARSKEASTTISAKLMCNITVNTELGTSQDRARARVWEPIGGPVAGIDGPETVVAENITLDGQGYMIWGLYGEYSDDRDVGLFGVAKNVTVQNLGLINAYFGADTGFVGGIVGEAQGGVTVTRCYVTGTMRSSNQTHAWIVGALNGEVSNPSGISYCYTAGETVVLAGAPGVGEYSTIENCYYHYPFSEEADSYVGTTRYDDEELLPDGETTLIVALSTQEYPWVKNCSTAMPSLVHDHVYQYPCTPECTVCGDTNRVNKADHTYLNACDRSCEVCGRINTAPVTHERYQSCGATCRICGAEIGAQTLHQYTNACDAVCDCGFERAEVPHVYDDACDNRCNVCNTPREAVPHTYDNDCDRVCNACGVTRPPKHVYDNVCDTDCNSCGEKRETTHEYGEFVVTKEPTALKNGEQERTCAKCGHKETEAVARLGVSLAVIIPCGVGAGLVLFAGGFSLYWFVIKKRSFAELLGKEPAKKAKKKK